MVRRPGTTAATCGASEHEHPPPPWWAPGVSVSVSVSAVSPVSPAFASSVGFSGSVPSVNT